MKIIGSITTYVGHEIPGYHGRRVQICAVMRHGVDIDGDEYYVTDDETLARLGGVRPCDHADVADLRANGTLSFVHCDPAVVDLECFRNLRDINVLKSTQLD
jgi:hypothetical protein